MQTFFVYRGVRGYHRVMRTLEYLKHPQREEIERSPSEFAGSSR